MKHSAINLFLGGAFILFASLGTFITMGRASVVLLLALVIAYATWAGKGKAVRDPVSGLLPAYIAGLVVMALHFGEEFLTGFQHQFPILFGYDWSDERFLVFNIVWLAVFALAALGVYYRIPLAYLVAWFFALGAGIGNGCGHLLLSLWQGRYFPGAITAPLCLVAGIVIVRRLAGAGRRLAIS